MDFRPGLQRRREETIERLNYLRWRGKKLARVAPAINLVGNLKRTAEQPHHPSTSGRQPAGPPPNAKG